MQQGRKKPNHETEEIMASKGGFRWIVIALLFYTLIN